MTDTTNISDLPAQQGTNITLEMREKQEGTIPTTNQPQGGPRPIPHHGGAPQQAPPRMQMPAADVGKLVSGIKSASAAEYSPCVVGWLVLERNWVYSVGLVCEGASSWEYLAMEVPSN